MKQQISSIALAMILWIPCAAKEEDDVAKQFVNATTLAFARVDTSSLQLPQGLSEVAANLALPTFNNLSFLAIHDIQSIARETGSETIYVVVDLPFSRAQAPYRLIAKKPKSMEQKKLKEKLPSFSIVEPSIQSDFLCLAPIGLSSRSQKVAIDNKTLDASRPDLMKAFQSVDGSPIRIAVHVPEYFRSTIRDLMPNLPAKLGGGPSSLLTDGLEWVAIGMDPKNLRLQTIVQGDSDDSAKLLSERLPDLLQRFAEEWSSPQVKQAFQPLRKLVRTEIVGRRITMESDILPNAVPVVSSLIEGLRAPILAQVKSDRLKGIGLAIHNYYSVNHCFPPNQKERDQEGKYALSWRVHILPFLGEQELYSKFHLDEPWNSEHNLQLLGQMPSQFSRHASKAMESSEKKPGHTVFLAPIGEDTLFGGTKPIVFGHITDGTSNTIMLVEVKPELSVPWTSPEDFRFDASKPAEGLAFDGDGKFLTLLGDGSVHLLSGSLPGKTLLNLFQMSDGNPIAW